MKTYWDLSEKERAGLTRKDVEAFVDAELMCKGVLRVTAPVYEEVPDAPAPDMDVFRIRNGSYAVPLDVAFVSAEKAREFLSLFGAVRVDARYLDGISASVGSSLNCFEIVSDRVYSESLMDRAQQLLKKKGAITAANERLKREYETALRAQDAALSGLWADWTACVAKADRIARLERTRQEYVAIAGSAEVAAQFLEKTFPTEAIAEAMEWSVP